MKLATRSIALVAVLAILSTAWTAVPCNGCAACRSACPAAGCHQQAPQLTSADCCSVAPADTIPAQLPRVVSPPAPLSATAMTGPALAAPQTLAAARPSELTRPPLRAVDRCTLFSTLLI